ncbi:hypothetical protein P152DRAFT_408957, partial [Eremomyces bilateralis CBS 781.70]
MGPVKIAVIGSICGQFKTVFSKLAALHEKNAFAFTIVVGDIFADPSEENETKESELEDLMGGGIEVPVPTYFTVGLSPFPDAAVGRLDEHEGELCPNLFYLGRKSTFKTSDGIRIVALGGVLDPTGTHTNPHDKYRVAYTEAEGKGLKGAHSADILISSEWPAGIQKGSRTKLPSESKDWSASQPPADVCAALKPRYHFSPSTLFYEREPFYHPPTDPDTYAYPVTRFLSLAPFGNPAKQKWIYAFTLAPAAAPSVTIPPGAGPSPLLPTTRKRPADSAPTYSRFADDGPPRGRGKRQKGPPPTPGECFFCLSNPNVATHLIASIGEEAYVTTAKGPLTTPTTFSKLPFPGHMLIIPQSHAGTLATIGEAEGVRRVYDEMQRFRGSLHKMLAEQGNGELGSVTWEVSRASGIHTHWQWLPVPGRLLNKRLVEAAFKVEAENEKYPKFVAKDVGDGVGEEGDFFRVMVWYPPQEGAEGSRETFLTLYLDPEIRFDMQFGRRVLAKLLGLERRLHWQDCAQSVDEEGADAEAFKAAFAKFDFTLQE